MKITKKESQRSDRVARMKLTVDDKPTTIELVLTQIVREQRRAENERRDINAKISAMTKRLDTLTSLVNDTAAAVKADTDSKALARSLSLAVQMLAGES